MNAARLSTWAIYEVHFNRWYASNRRFSHFTPERKIQASAKIKGHSKNNMHMMQLSASPLKIFMAFALLAMLSSMFPNDPERMV